MQFTSVFYAIAALAAVVVAVPTADRDTSTGITSSIVSEAEMAHWLATTDAELTFIGDRPAFNPLDKRSAQSSTVTYCTKRVGPVCGGSCTVYSGSATCLETPDTMCLSATKDIGYCDAAGCQGNCDALSLCGSPLGGGWCFAPMTQSIVVSDF
ncbi:hypothetical protein PYCCODRAFT_1437714 [Trametes coccinea BRFM310]|uniref:Uncharacterized protein n=1 Tax=Trametes coccinea (strain BRFM310) TaxID=1353009 RepID=A0A1Y2IGA6_TRAC3|nr:hypothetical protein PYCCODRAFT_1437714 [Trametes coccinea BRFM310]